ncbi:uncharacterized protein K489DRAFT_135715 [Dissoconium aciculare CBS 342.82]|uniref:F-box domain-containing protein n=1 Tax=Dissoconium aciculare CBS 342.82 TaxID=1314786 RepID=A0A6J3LTW8_9PEZI|nr:uncharacterized protein K489DRAFT_135715 [Dissoconium aciculare CBS 342.82]KAF1818067.1 hypothetical protein K489DRAFT_135715 [Dissoconium aciculare CBS 342.82]
MDRLIADVMLNICDELDQKSIHSLAHVNRHFQSVLIPALYRNVTIKFSTVATLDWRVRHYERVLQKYHGFEFVRSLSILAGSLETPRAQLLDCGDRPMDLWKFCHVDKARTELLDNDEQWEDVATLMKKLPGLKDFTWGCFEVLPPAILKVLDGLIPACRLHMANFRLNSLFRPPKEPLQITAHELALATSPSLRTLTLLYDLVDDGGNQDYHAPAVRAMARGAAPNLREVHILQSRRLSSKRGHWARGQPRQKYRRSLIPVPPSEPTKGVLDTLTIFWDDRGESIRTWHTVIDFSRLRALHLHDCITSTNLDWMATNCEFSSLESLVLSPSHSLDFVSLDESVDSAVDSFLGNLPPLRSFRLIGYDNGHVIGPFLTHCGATLREFRLAHPDEDDAGYDSSKERFINTAMLDILQTHCPNLEILSIPSLRAHGDSWEVAFYRRLGQLPRLRRLHLRFDHLPVCCNNCRTGIEHSTDYAEREAARTEAALINHSIDETLAWSIFRVIAAARPPGAPPLECLEVGTYFDDVLRWKDDAPYSSQLFRWIARSYRCTVNPRDDAVDECFVEEYASQHRLAREEFEKSGKFGQVVTADDLLPVLERVWPGTRKMGLERMWHAFPLELDD